MSIPIAHYPKCVIVSFNDEACGIIEKLDKNLPPKQSQELLRKAQKFSVDVYEAQYRKLLENHALRILKTGAVALEKRFYDDNCGVKIEGAAPELLIY